MSEQCNKPGTIERTDSNLLKGYERTERTVTCSKVMNWEQII